MRMTGVFLVVVSLALSACGDGGDGSGSPQAELAELMLAEDEFGFSDEQCVRDKTKQLSDKDAQILVDNIENLEPPARANIGDRSWRNRRRLFTFGAVGSALDRHDRPRRIGSVIAQ